MGKKLIITEKPSVARDYAAVLNARAKKNGYIENDEYIITWCFGHLVEMLYPEAYDIKYKKWTLKDLPFLPESYKYGVVQSAREQYELVNSMLHRDDIDVVYWAGDSGKEGQTIEENIRNFGGVREGMKELRVWVDSQTEEELLRGIREAKPMSDYASLGDSGIMRAIEDYALGINFSRALSVKYGGLLNKAAANTDYQAIAVGRVMTCVLGMVVDREREIRDFKDTPFFRVLGRNEDHIPFEWRAVEGSKYFESPKLYKENGFKQIEDANALIRELDGKTGAVSFVEKKISKKKAPALYNLAELQADCSKIFKITPSQTLDIAQELYEKKLTTYPRTDARVLTTAVAKEITKNINGLKYYSPVKSFAENILNNKMYVGIEKSQYTDDSKVTDHYAIIPTGQTNAVDSLNDLSRRVYELIVRRFLAIFYPAAEYTQGKLNVKIESETLFGSAKILTKLGYMEVSGAPKAKNTDSKAKDENSDVDSSDEIETSEDEKRQFMSLVETLKVGDSILLSEYEVKEGKTSPPKRYTSGTIILAMENAGNLIEDEELRAQIKTTGIGTAATRQGILEKLDTNKYICINKKTQVITPENFGEMIYEVVKLTCPTLLNPEMTASWEKGLDGITQRTVSFADYRSKLEDFVRKGTMFIVDSNLAEQISDKIFDFSNDEGKGALRHKINVACPDCGGDMITTPFGYGCANYKREEAPCKFAIGKIAEHDLSIEEVTKLLTEGKTDVISGFVGKSKKHFRARLVLSKNEEQKSEIRFDFEDIAPEVVPDVKCPDCGADLVVTGFGYGCSNYSRDDSSSCQFVIGKIASKELNVSQVQELINTGKTKTIRGFKSKTGKKFDACLVLKKEEGQKSQISFDFENVENKVVKDLKCPFCNGDINKSYSGYICSNYNKEDPQGCKLFIGKIAGVQLKDDQVRDLLTKKITEPISGFKSKTGKKFDARLALSDYDIQFVFNTEETVETDILCPRCEHRLMRDGRSYSCECGFKLYHTIAQKRLSDEEISQLISKGRTDKRVTGFTSKKGTLFDTVLTYKDEKISFDFNLDEI